MILGRRQRATLAAVAVAVAAVCALALSGCAPAARTAGSDHAGGARAGATATILPAPASLAAAPGIGAALLRSAELPPGARPIASSSSPELKAPLTQLGCAAVEGHRFWQVAGTLVGVEQFLQTHPARHLLVEGSGIGGDRADLTDAEVTESIPTTADVGGSSLVYSAATTGPSTITVRVDAEIVIAHRRCPHFGGAGFPSRRSAP